MPDPESFDPTHPEPSPDATQRLSIGPVADPFSTQRLNISQHLEAEGDLNLPLPGAGTGSADTKKSPLSRVDEPPIRVEKQDHPTETAGRTLERLPLPTAPRALGWKGPLAVGVLLVLGVLAYLVFARGPVPQALRPTADYAEAESPGTEIYLQQAKAGDAHAMRMLGVLYYNGLNVPRDREKGLYWYRKAAEKGSDAAKSELRQMEGGR